MAKDQINKKESNKKEISKKEGKKIVKDSREKKEDSNSNNSNSNNTSSNTNNNNTNNNNTINNTNNNIKKNTNKDTTLKKEKLLFSNLSTIPLPSQVETLTIKEAKQLTQSNRQRKEFKYKGPDVVADSKSRELSNAELLDGFTYKDLGLGKDTEEEETKEQKRVRVANENKELRKKSADVLKRAHMGAAGRSQIPQSQSVNWAEGSDSSDDEEGQLNRIGNIPLEWYEDEEHIGYNIDGVKIKKRPASDQIDAFLKRMEDPNANRTVYDAVNDKYVVLTDEELNIIRKIRKGQAASEIDTDQILRDAFDTEEKEVCGFGPLYEPKRRFIPSKHEAKTVMKFVQAIRNGWIKLEDDESDNEEEPYLLWKDGETISSRQDLLAPKTKLPGHAESYRPPGEYLFTEEEEEAWKAMDPEDRPLSFIPKSFNSMREIPLFEDFIKERFERCLDLYLCPRGVAKPQINAANLLPAIPKASDLRPFPTILAQEYPHNHSVTCMSVAPGGQWMCSADIAGNIKIWEVDTGYCMANWQLDGKISAIAFATKDGLPLLAVSSGNIIYVYNTFLASMAVNETTSKIFDGPSNDDSTATWTFPKKPVSISGFSPCPVLLACITLKASIREHGLSWHSKGEYLASVTTEATADAVLIHRLPKKQSQNPFAKSRGAVKSVMFHNTQPVLFIATKRHVRVYNLSSQKLVKKLTASVDCISSMALHPGGDNLIIGSDDRRVCWFDMDLSTTPYRSIKYHLAAVTQTDFHSSYPLFCSSSVDGSIHIYHGMVYADMMQNPLIVPVKIIQAHAPGVSDCKWHPKQPWIFSCGGDKMVKLFH